MNMMEATRRYGEHPRFKDQVDYLRNLITSGSFTEDEIEGISMLAVAAAREWKEQNFARKVGPVTAPLEKNP